MIAATDGADIYPKEMKHPEHGFYVIPTRGPHAALAARYLDAMRNAANFAFANRLLLGLMTVRVLSEVLGRDVDARLVYDAPHNLIWGTEDDDILLHRKGACPALGGDPILAGSPHSSRIRFCSDHGSDAGMSSLLGR